EVADRASTASAGAFYLGGYGGTTWGATSLDTGIAFSGHDLKTERSVSTEALSELVSASYGGRMWQVFTELRPRVLTGQCILEPFANAAYVPLLTDGFMEKGGAASLSVDRHMMATTTASADLRLKSILGEGKVTMVGTLGWSSTFGETAPQTLHAFQGGDEFAVAGLPIAAGVGFVDLGLEVNLGSNLTLSAIYSGQIGSEAQHHAINLAIGKVF